MEHTPSSWNVELFVDVLKDLLPSLNWVQVIQELDHPGFVVKDPKGLQMIVYAFIKASNSQFPIQVLYKPWNNALGQVRVGFCSAT